MLTASAAHLKITGFKHHKVVEELFSSLLVDVAYVIEANDQQILVAGDETENRSLEYKTWLRSVVFEVLSERGQPQSLVEILNSNEGQP